MRQNLLAFTVVALMIFGTSDIHAQSTIDVAKFTRLENDLTARVTRPVKDTDEGKLCALIRVITTLRDIEFKADALGIVKQEKHNGEIWLYIPYGARSMSFSHDGYFPLFYQYSDKIEEGMVYELRLKSYSSMETAAASNAHTQLFVLSHNPDEASVFIDDMEVKSENGVFAAMMSKGTHTYKVAAEQFDTQEGEFELGNELVRVDATLRPQFGQFELFTLPAEGFDVYLNNENVGKSPYKSERLTPGKYNVRIEKEKFYPIDTVLNIEKGVTSTLTCTLTSFSDSLFYNRRFGGRKLSIGVQAGYMMPTISTSSGGGFTGSPINYSFADPTENADYKSTSGFTVGVFGDLRLYKNLYLMFGVDYTCIKYRNSISGTLNDHIVQTTSSTVARGTTDFSYKEDYTLHNIEIPVMASYRFVLTRVASLHVNAGPFIGYGLSAKMKLSGSQDSYGEYFLRYGNQADYSTPIGTFNYNEICSGDIDLYGKENSVSKIVESGAGVGNTNLSEYSFSESPLNRLNYGLKFGAVYELKGFRLGLNYSLMLSNMANKDYWESTRIPVFNGQTGGNNMSGYKQRAHTLEIKLGYVFRY
ncbi:MAG: PorT family protein [Bacteroides sp.]|nr:PorT family protein [Roseburia sp.]MCM1347629.1 PorT family protein [Bacteroides sp.]MCM1422055.1 PorT family protein [Bacteroides sp.]